MSAVGIGITRLNNRNVLFNLLLFLSATTTTTCLENYEINEAIERDKMRLPEFYMMSYLDQCTLDSPEQYYHLVALPSLNALLQEGKTFFGVLLDNLDEALQDDGSYDKLKSDWEYLTDVLLASFQDRQASIEWLWKKFIRIFETISMPWEDRIKGTVLLEVIGAVHYDYLVLEAAIRMAVREIVSVSLKEPFTKIMKDVEQEISAKYGNGAPDSETFVRNLERTLKEIEPNFIGKLLAAILTRARMTEKGEWKERPSFLSVSMQQIGILVTAFREKSHEYKSQFWGQMTQIMFKDLQLNNSIDNDQLFLMYSKSQDRVIRNVMYLLSPK